MAATEKFIVLPFKKGRAGIVPGEMRQASNAASAERIAASMSARFIGVVALAPMADNETGEMSAARLLSIHGETADLASMIEFKSDDEEAKPESVQEVKPVETPVVLADEIEMVAQSRRLYQPSC